MTEIIPGLQGDLPANMSKGTPYVNGKYESLFFPFHRMIYSMSYSFDLSALLLRNSVKATNTDVCILNYSIGKGQRLQAVLSTLWQMVAL